MLTKEFWLDALERAIRSAAQGFLATWALFERSFDGLVSADPYKGAAAMLVLSLLTSVVGSTVGNRRDPSLVR